MCSVLESQILQAPPPLNAMAMILYTVHNSQSYVEPFYGDHDSTTHKLA